MSQVIPQATRFAEVQSGVISTLSVQPNWRKTWHAIVPVQLGGSLHTDLLFYDRIRGEGAFYETNGVGGMTLKRSWTNWSKTWDQIIPGHFAGSSTSPTDLLFYDASSGLARFYQVHPDATIRLLAQYNFQHWDMIIPGDFGGTAHTDLLFYSRTRGEAKIYRTNGAGQISLLKAHTVQKTWDKVVPGEFGGGSGTDLFFYRQITGDAKFYSVNSTGDLVLLRQYVNLSPDWDEIVAGSFRNQASPTDLLFYHRAEGRYRFAYVQAGAMTFDGVRFTSNRYGRIVPGRFGSRYGAVFYDRTQWLRIHAVRCLNANGSRATAVTAAQVRTWVDQANRAWGAAGIRFLFDPQTDFEEIFDDQLNRLDLCGTYPTQAECDRIRAVATSYADREPCKITVFFRYGNGTSPSGGGFSSPNFNYVVMPGFDSARTNYYYLDTTHPNHRMRRPSLKLLAHEFGHYFSLGHTHLGDLDYTGVTDPHAAVVRYMRGKNLKTATDMDADRSGVRDTPADLGISYFLLSGWNPGNPLQEVRIRSVADGIDFTINPDTHNVMSYYGFCNEYMRITPEQSRKARDFLHEPHRRPLLDLCSYPGFVETFGTSCKAGQVHYLAGRPRRNAGVSFELQGVLPNALVSFVLGSSRTQWGSTPLPLGLDALGMTGCFLYTNPWIQVARRADSQGQAWVTGIVPVDPQIIGTHVYTQYAVWTPGAPGGLTTTNAVDTRFGG